MSLDQAIKLAQANPIERITRMAAIIFDRKKLVSFGLNQIKTHPLQNKFCKNHEAIFLHAEIAAIVNARVTLDNMTMYIARVTRDNKPALAKPCTGCQRALIHYNFKDVIWTE